MSENYLNTFKMFPELSPFHPKIENELNRRKNTLFGSNNKPRTVWVRAVSNASNDDNIRSDLNILCGGILSVQGRIRGGFGPIYKRPSTRKIQDRPIPGIESISIQNTGNFGSLRKVSISWFCANVEDLEELAPYWLSVGITVLVECGWCYNNKNINVVDTNLSAMLEYYKNPSSLYNDVAFQNNGNQDAFFGKISNFSYNSNDDGSFSCVTELVTPGELMIGMSVQNDKVSQTSKEEEKNKQIESVTKFFDDDLRAEWLENIQYDFYENDEIDHSGKTYFATKDIIKTSNTFTNIIKGAYAGAVIYAKSLFGKERKVDIKWSYNIFITWRFIERYIINKHMCPIFSKTDDYFFKLDSNDIRIIDDPALYTTDASICLLYKLGDNKYVNFSDNFYGKLNNLYFNFDVVKEAFLNSNTLREAILKILRQASYVCGDAWDFEIHVNPIDTKIIKIVDMNFADPEQIQKFTPTSNSEILDFGGYGQSSLLRSVSFTSKMTNQLALTHMYARNKDDDDKTAVSNTNDVGTKIMFGKLQDRIDRSIKRNKKEDIKIKKELSGEGNVSIDDAKRAFESNTRPTTDVSDFDNILVYDTDVRSDLRDYLKRRFNKIKTNPKSQQILYPLEIEVEIDGISGIIPGNVFILSNVPSVYRDNGVFQVVNVNHEISGDDWSTKIRAMFRLTNFEESGQLQKEQEIKEGLVLDDTKPVNEIFGDVIVDANGDPIDV